VAGHHGPRRPKTQPILPPREALRGSAPTAALEGTHQLAQLAALHALHHPLHLHELLQQPVHVLHLGPRTSRNAATAGSIDDPRIAAFLAGHGIDDGNLPPQVTVALLCIDGTRLLGRRGRQLVHEGAYAPHLLQLLELTLEVDHVEALPFDDLARKPLGLLGIDLPMYLLDEADDIAHAQNARSHALGVERLQCLGLFTDADKHDRLTGDLTYR